MLERTTVFVDTSYLLASFYNSLEIGARAQLEIDLPEVVATLGSMIENQLGHPVHRQNWYDGIPDTGPHRYQRALRTCNGVQLRTGQLIEWGERRAQKGVDTRLVADMVIAGLNQQVTDFVLVSGDADMIPGVEEAANNGIRVHLYGFGWDSMSSALRHACDTTTILDPREDFADAMKLQLLEGPLPPTIREPRGDDERDDAAGADDTSAPGDAGQDAGQNAGDHAERAEASGATEPYSNTTPEDTHAHDSAKAGANSAEAAQVSADAAQTSAVESSLSREGSRTSAPTPADVAKNCAPAHDGGADSTREAKSEPESPKTEATKNATGDAADDKKPESSDGADKPSPSTPSSMPSKGRPAGRPKPSMMAPRRKLRSRYVPLPEEVWASAGFQTPFDVGQQYASWWFDNAATAEQRDQAHLLSGGGLPPEVDRPLLQFACETLHEYTLSESQRVNLRDGFHSGIRGVLINIRRGG